MKRAIVVGGGFYGTTLAEYLKVKRGWTHVTVIESEPGLLQRASYANQARVHGGYHYPRSFTTAFRSRENFCRFNEDYGRAVKRDFIKVYALGQRNSKVVARQFQRFCADIGAPLHIAPPAIARMFHPKLIERVFIAEEYAFDASILADIVFDKLKLAQVEVMLQTTCIDITQAEDHLAVHVQGADDSVTTLRGDVVFNCTYSALGHITREGGDVKSQLKHEIAEMGLVEVPQSLTGIAVTVMDGPFFSLMPFPARGLHTLSHVRYTPHLNWLDRPGLHPRTKLKEYELSTRVDRMIRDAGRYMPPLLGCRHVDSLLEVKTVLVRNESDDGRPILWEPHPRLRGVYSILGGKIDNIYDILQKLDALDDAALMAGETL